MVVLGDHTSVPIPPKHRNISIHYRDEATTIDRLPIPVQIALIEYVPVDTAIDMLYECWMTYSQISSLDPDPPYLPEYPTIARKISRQGLRGLARRADHEQRISLAKVLLRLREFEHQVRYKVLISD